MIKTLRVVSLLLAASALTAQTAPPARDATAINTRINAELPADQAAMKAHVMFLASDAMQGREAGTPSYDVAAQYVASQFYSAGLRPGGDAGSYLQRVPLLRVKAASEGSFTFTPPRGQPIRLEFGKDYIPSADPERDTTTINAPLAFVGFGISAPALGRDDYRGIDVRGKIVVFFSGVPGDMGSEERAHLGGRDAKAETAAAKGAIGYIVIQSPQAGPRSPSFEMISRGWQGETVTWAGADGTGRASAPGVPRLGTLSLDGAAKLFAGAATPFDRIAEQARASSNPTLAPMVLPGRLAVELKTTREPFESSNVVGVLEGGDPALKGEYVVLTAHLDHVGVGRAVNGDTIYNGAMDNAVGIASLIEEAKRFKASGQPPKRSILFVALTAEEKGLVGADYFATNPTVPKEKMVANVNLDMPLITYTFQDMIAFGSDRTTLGPIVRQAVADLGLTFSPDPMPEQALFVRSDHYRFVQQGIPSVFLWPGHAGEGKAAFDEFFAKHYHRPSDEVSLEAMRWDQGVRFIEANYRIARAIADAPERPRWNKGDFFGLLYNGVGAR